MKTSYILSTIVIIAASAIVFAFIGNSSRQDHDCNSYPGTAILQETSGTWSEPNEQDTYPDFLMTPSDPGGGFWEISVGSDAPAVPWLIVDPDINVDGAIIAGSSASTSNEQVRRAAFLAHPGEAYTVQVDPFFEGIIEEYPWPYNISYSFTSRVDCYEPNDDINQAKSIPVDHEIKAYAIGGFRTNAVSSFDKQTYDWYQFTIHDSSKLKVELTQSPTDVRIDMRIFKTEKRTESIKYTVTSGQLNDPGRLCYIESYYELKPGSYFLEVHHSLVTRKINHDETIPDHWNTQYKLRVSLL